MEKRSRFRELIKYRAGALCLIGILSATYLHSTTFMSQFFYHSLILGGVAAFAIDAGVVAMSIFKDELLKDGELAWMVRIVTCIVLFASGVANMAEGFKSAYGINLTLDSLMALDPLTWTQWLAGTIVFPIMAYVMCDTIGTRNLVALRQQQLRTNGHEDKSLVPVFRKTSTLNGSLQSANAKIKKNKEYRKELLHQYLEDYPEATLTQMADAIGVSSRETVRKYLNEMNRVADFSDNRYKFSEN